MHPNKKRVLVSLPVVLTVLMVFFIITTGVLVALVSFRGTRDTVQFLISDIMEDSRARILDDTLEYVFEGSDSLEFLSGLVQTNQLAPDINQVQASGPEVIVGFLEEFLSENDQFLSAAITNPGGLHVRVLRMDDGTLSTYIQAPRGNFVVSQFRHANPSYAAEFPPAAQVPAASAYRPRETEWYQNAISERRLVWSDARVLDVSSTGGLTSAAAIFQNDELAAVISLDISLSEISRFLGSSPGLKSISFIVDPQSGAIVAFSESESLPGSTDEMSADRFVVEDGDTARLVRVGDLDNELLSTALAELRPVARQLLDGESAEFPINLEEQSFFSSFSRFPEETGWNWAIGILVPQEVFLDQISEDLRTSLLVSVGVILIGILISMVLARGVSRPLRRLSADMMQIREFELDKSARIRSNLREVSEMSNALEGMKAGLRSFKKFVPAGLVRQLIELGQEAELGGEQKSLTIFFSDIAGFSEIAERLPPEELVVRLGEYLGALSDVIRDHNGTVDKYIGDAIMAFWGAPVDLEHPELVAVETALECQREANRINQRWIQEGLDVEFSIRIGINTGELIVGNMGSESRLNYTVIGDAVNLASRLEGANKYYRTQIMISESTYEAVGETIACRVIDKVRVKGRHEPILVYEPLGRREEMAESDAKRIDQHNEAWRLYADSRFREAAARFKKLYLADKSDSLAALYFKRCAAYIESPPAKDWNAVNRLVAK